MNGGSVGDMLLQSTDMGSAQPCVEAGDRVTIRYAVYLAMPVSVSSISTGESDIADKIGDLRIKLCRVVQVLAQELRP